MSINYVAMVCKLIHSDYPLKEIIYEYQDNEQENRLREQSQL